jgi:SAM-dependent methyltransferase
MAHQKFDISQLERLNDEARFEYLPPDALWQAVARPDAHTIVEIGAGTGLFACRFAELCPEADIYAIDIEPAAVRWMLRNRPLSICGRLHPLLGQETVVPLPTGEADVVVMINLHHELADPIASYREALRVLAIGGRLMVADWAPGAVPGGPPDEIRSSAERISEVVSAVGFSAIEIHPDLPRHTLITAEKPEVCSL